MEEWRRVQKTIPQYPCQHPNRSPLPAEANCAELTMLPQFGSASHPVRIKSCSIKVLCTAQRDHYLHVINSLLTPVILPALPGKRFLFCNDDIWSRRRVVGISKRQDGDWLLRWTRSSMSYKTLYYIYIFYKRERLQLKYHCSKDNFDNDVSAI